VIDTLTVGRGNSGVATNTAVGVSALAAVTSGYQNVAVGDNAGKSLTTGTLNTAIGSNAFALATTGTGNTAFGFDALSALLIGTVNTCIGRGSGSKVTSSGNTFVGAFSGNTTNTGGDNTAIGYNAIVSNTTGSNLVAIGHTAGQYHANGSTSLTTAANSIYIGYQVRGFNNSDSNSIVIGYQAIGEGANTVVIGNSSTVQQHFYATRYLKTEGSMVFASSTPAAITANQNDYVLTGSAFQRLNCTTASDITGIAPPTGGSHVDGRMIRLVSVGTATVTLKHNDTGSAAANRIYMHAGNHTSLTVNEWADLVYDSTDNGSGAAGWRLVKYA
jgi:hypothetical protein